MATGDPATRRRTRGPEAAETASFVQRLGTSVLVTLGAIALLLAAVGLDAATAYAVARRTREIGIRVA